MRGYDRDELDTDRAKTYPASDERQPQVPPTRESLRTLVTSLDSVMGQHVAPQPLTRQSVETLMCVAFGKLRSRQVHASGRAPVVRRTSPSGGSRHPTEGYVLTYGVNGLSDA